MNPYNYELTPDEIALMVHHALRESFPESDIDSRLVRAAVILEEVGRYRIKIADLAPILTMSAKDLAQRLYIELNIEGEKNWHDRAFFNIVLAGDSIFFQKAK